MELVLLQEQMTDKEQCSWCSFMPALVACVAATKGPVLELGMGHFSTPVLHALCGSLGRQLMSFEKNDEWRGLFTRYNTKLHEIYGDIDNGMLFTGLMNIGVVFIDDSPGGENRKKHFVDFIDISDYVIAHDYEKDNEEAIGPLLVKVPFKYVTRTYQPPTLIASMTREIPKSVLCL